MMFPNTVLQLRIMKNLTELAHMKSHKWLRTRGKNLKKIYIILLIRVSCYEFIAISDHLRPPDHQGVLSFLK